MKTTERFDQAVTKLYNAFHSGTLNALDCKACAVGNICNNNSDWAAYFRHSCQYIGTADRQETPLLRMWGDKLFYGSNVLKSGYDSNELYMIEEVFLRQFIGGFAKDKERQFQGLCAVVEYLCELDGIPNVMDFQKLFEYDKEGAKHELTL